MCKKLKVLLCSLFVYTLLANPSNAHSEDASELVHEAHSEESLRKLLKLKYPNDSVTKFKSGGAEVICIMPRLKGGGSGVRSILVYCGSDLQGGWGLRLNCATFFTDITAQVNQGFLVFTGSGTDKVIIKLALNFGVFDQKGHPSN